MATKDFIIKHKIITIYRKIYGDTLKRLAEALHAGGIRMMEVTFDQQDPDCIKKTAGAIQMLAGAFGESMQFGAGTVLTPEQVRATQDAGGRFVISPNTDPEVIRCTKELGLVSIPGAMTPSEIMTAHNCGADFVKLFPSGALGFRYIKDILAPISHVKLIATGGVSEDDLGQYLELGFAGAGVGGRLADKKLIADGNFLELTERAKKFVAIAQGS